MPIFGVNQESSNLPIKQIKNMKAQGMDNNQIIQALQRDGYSSSDIFDAMNQTEMPSVSDNDSANVQSGSSSVQKSSSTGDSSGNEELIEAIIDEKWNDLVKDFNTVLDWKKSTENKLVSIEQKFEDLKGEFDKIHKAILSKVDDYDKNITQVGAEVKAMEKVFSKVLPLFTENVKELSRITKDLKK